MNQNMVTNPFQRKQSAGHLLSERSTLRVNMDQLPRKAIRIEGNGRNEVRPEA